jgi:DNA-binding transcriptional MerR regulator
MARGKNKIYYKIGEACKVLDIQPYVLRYWETEFPSLAPNKSSSGQRVYTENELDVIRRIKVLLYDEGYTIAGAKKKLEGELEVNGEPGEPEPRAAADEAAEERIQELETGIRRALAEARAILDTLGG